MAGDSQNSKEIVFRLDVFNIIKVVLVLLLFVVLFILRDLVLVLIAAVVIASAIEPMVRWFKKYKIGRLPSVVIIYIILAFLFIAAFYFLFVPLLNETSSLFSNLPSYLSSANLWTPLGENTFLGSQQFVRDLSANFSVQDVVNQVQIITSSLSAGIFSALSLVFGGALSFFLIIILSFYLAVQEDGIKNFLKTITPIDNRAYVLDLWSRAENKIGLWFQGQILLVVIIAVLTYLGLTLVGIEHSLLLAILAGLFEIIPLFGPILAAIPAIAIAFLTGGIGPALIVVAFYVIIQQFENQLIYPLVVKKVVGVPAIVVILAFIAGGTLVGFLGILLSVPVAAIMMELFKDVQQGTFGRKVTAKGKS